MCTRYSDRLHSFLIDVLTLSLTRISLRYVPNANLSMHTFRSKVVFTLFFIYIYHYWSISDSKFLCNIVSLTALNTTFIFSVSTAVVKWWKSGFLGSLFTDINISSIKFCTSFMECESPANCGKYQRTFVSGDLTFLSNKSVLFKNKIIDTPPNIMLLTIVSNIFLDSSNRLVLLQRWIRNFI